MSTIKKQRVVVTGLGLVSSIGTGQKAFLDALIQGKNGASKVRAFNTEKFPSHIGCEVQDFQPEFWIKKLPFQQLGRSSQLAIAAARLAIADSGINEVDLEKSFCDVVMGTTDGESATFDHFTEAWIKNSRAPKDSFQQLYTAEAISDAIQSEFCLSGDSLVLATACSAGNYAIGYAFDKIHNGVVDTVLCGGSDSQCLKNFGGFYRIGALAPEACQPFDLNRKGILPGEGAAVLILESLEHAEKRKANIYAEILGYGASCDGYHVMSPNKDGIVACNQDALKRCGISATDVDYICAHGTATASNDVVETAAMREIFGTLLPPMSSIKSMLGHTMGAASALSAIACCLALKHQFMPPTIHFSTIDPECAIDCVPNHSRKAQLQIVQNNAFAFGGNNAIVLLKRHS